MRAAAVQFKADRSDLTASRAGLATLAAQAGRAADLVVLPEMAATGYVFEHRDDVAEVAEAPTGPTFAALSAVAKGCGTWVVAGFPERSGDDLYNSAMVIDPHGELASVYRKTLLFEADLGWATPGDTGYRTFTTASGRFGVGICMDLNDVRFLRWLWSTRMEALAFPTNWIEEGVDVWPYWAARMGRSRAALVAANTWGQEGPYAFSGRSAILRRGEVLASAPHDGDGVIVGAWSPRG